MSEEDIIVWQDILDLVAAGRAEGLTCPFCQKGELTVDEKEHRTRLECPSCRRFIEGSMRGSIRVSMSKNHLGKGWRYPVDTNRNGGVAMSVSEDTVRESIAMILGTAPGERVMRPAFGCEIHDLLFAPNNPNTAGLAAHYCVEALQKWEPRINQLEAEAVPSKDEPNKLLIHIRFKIRATGNKHNMVYPFYLRRGEE